MAAGSIAGCAHADLVKQPCEGGMDLADVERGSK
jgi:hypothetical protein